MAKYISVEMVASRIFEIRGKKVMLDEDLAKLYGVKNKALLQAVKRNKSRFPPDFMYHLVNKEVKDLRSQFVTSKPSSRGGRRYLPYAFTQEGVAMLSSVLNSERAVRVNIQIMRAFVKMREMLFAHKDLSAKIEALERRYACYDEKIQVIFEAIKRLLEPPAPPPPVEEKRVTGFQP